MGFMSHVRDLKTSAWGPETSKFDVKDPGNNLGKHLAGAKGPGKTGGGRKGGGGREQ